MTWIMRSIWLYTVTCAGTAGKFWNQPFSTQICTEICHFYTLQRKSSVHVLEKGRHVLHILAFSIQLSPINVCACVCVSGWKYNTDLCAPSRPPLKNGVVSFRMPLGIFSSNVTILLRLCRRHLVRSSLALDKTCRALLNLHRGNFLWTTM